jgi:hypothetical protein
MVAKLDAGIDVSQEFYFTAHDLFRITGISGSARSYSRLSDALERLQDTQMIPGHLHDLYGIDVSPDLISTVTDAVRSGQRSRRRPSRSPRRPWSGLASMLPFETSLSFPYSSSRR